MATAEGERVLEAWATALTAHDTERFLALFTEDCVYEAVPFGAVNHGKAALRAWVEHTFTSTPDFTVTVTTRFAVGKGAVMEWVMSGTHSGDYPGIPATGQTWPKDPFHQCGNSRLYSTPTCAVLPSVQ